MFYLPVITQNKFEDNPGEEEVQKKNIQNKTSPFDNL